MKTITKKQFLVDVMHEIEMLKTHATEKEKVRLGYTAINPARTDHCVYGQLTGDCQNKRAKKLMDLSCTRVFSQNIIPVCREINFSDVKSKINGEYTGQDWGTAGRNLVYISALEGYISLKDAKNAEIIAYIKGEREALSL